MGIVSAALGEGDSQAVGEVDRRSIPSDCSSAGSEIAELACEWARVGGNPELAGAVSDDRRAAWAGNVVKVRD